MTIKNKKKSDKAPSPKAPPALKRPAAKVKPGKRKPKATARPKSSPASTGSKAERASASQEGVTSAPARVSQKAGAAPTKQPRPKTAARAKSGRKKPLQPEVIEPVAAKSPKAKAKAKATASADKALVKFDPLQRYLAEISNYRLLTRDEERTLGIRVQEHGDKEAAYSLVTANLRLVVKIALEFQRVWMQNLLDLIQEGNIGLMQAVRKFDPYKNVKFSYYASFWIKAYILKFIMDNWRLVKIGTTQGQRKLFFKLKKEKQKLIEQGFDPKPKLLSERLGVSEREIVDMDQRLDGWDVSLDAPLKDDSDTERIEFLSTESVSAEDQVAKKEIEVLLHNKIDEFRKNMTDREKEIFDLRIFSDTPVTLQEIGDRYGISRERVRQVEKNIIKKMREFFRREIPDFSAYTEGQENE
jgi:RNA polymerase sigma-32 factor